jgi:hypothetical protein
VRGGDARTEATVFFENHEQLIAADMAAKFMGEMPCVLLMAAD